uniref:Uncharacterized protein n=1 Tax=Cucumis melo TaxID=3656 RepID=A0A9I9E7S1_CUCME
MLVLLFGNGKTIMIVTICGLSTPFQVQVKTFEYL